MTAPSALWDQLQYITDRNRPSSYNASTQTQVPVCDHFQWLFTSKSLRLSQEYFYSQFIQLFNSNISIILEYPIQN